MHRTRFVILAALFAALTAIGAYIRIPTPVSAFTLQVLFTAMAGILLGKTWGAASQVVYVLLGLAGLPVFVSGGGLQALAQPTAGFLLGLIPMAWVTGWVTERTDGSFWGLCAACTAGLAVLYAVGLPYLHGILTLYLDREWSLRQTLFSGMLIFLPWDVVKILLTGALCRRIRPGVLKIL